ncbi:MAG: TIGR04211 family SH3 domain-containing protein [Desulfuromonadales bacterium]
MRYVILIFMLTLLMLSSGQAIADKQYVSDELIITLRRGEGDEYKILKMLKTGTPLEILQEGKADYVFVRTPNGTEGWVKKQYLTNETPKPTVIAHLKKERDQLREQVNQLEIQQAELTAALENSRNDLAGGNAAFADLQKELDKVQSKYDDLHNNAANVVKLTGERDRLKSHNDQLSAEVDQLRQDNESMLYTGAVKWFLAGAGVLLVGVILGKTTRKKKGFSY